MDLNLTKRKELASSITKTAIYSNLFLSVLKLIAGILGNSAAMIADAFHSLSDLLSDFVVLAGFKLANKPADKTHPYGHGKIETFVALLIGAMLFAVGVGIVINAVWVIKKIIEGQQLLSPNKIAVFMAVISIVVKELLYQKTVSLAKKIDSPVLLANAWHHRSDALSSIAAFLGISGAHFLGQRWLFLDPLAALIVAFLIIKLSIKVTLESLNDLLEASLKTEDNLKIKNLIAETDGVKDVHAMRTRRLGPGKAVEAHICVDPDLSIVEAHDIASAIEDRLRDNFGDSIHVAIHVEPLGYDR